MGAGWQRWWADPDAELQDQADEMDGVVSREQVGNCTVVRYDDGRVNYAWEQHVISVGIPRFIGHDPATGRCYEIPQPGPDEVLRARSR